MKYLVWGTGSETKRLLDKGLLRLEDIICFVDSYKTGRYLEREIYNPTNLDGVKGWKYILVTVTRDADKLQIYNLAQSLYISEKLIFLYNKIFLDEITDVHKQNESILACISQKLNNISNAVNWDKSRMQLTYQCGKDRIDEKRLVGKNQAFLGGYIMDYNRYRSFELVAEEVISNNILGETAELGVFTGAFSRLIHAKFPDRLHYMYDTFSSFDADEFQREVNAGNCGKEFYDIFTNTSIEQVMNGMMNPDKCVIRQGFFPNTIQKEDYDKTYCFVSLDVDLEESTYQGLCFFYPRLAEGGYIFLHDYNNAALFGVKKAVDRYVKQNGRMRLVPICDEGGTLIIAK